jgi:hypothetical protein
MERVEYDGHVIFNGMRAGEHEPYAIRLLGGSGMLEVSAKNLFSNPISGGENFIVVNDIPAQAECCFVEFSSRFSEATGISTKIELVQKRRGALKSELGLKNSELLARGIDPAGQNFISNINLKPVSVDAVAGLENELVRITLYGMEAWNRYPEEN